MHCLVKNLHAQTCFFMKNISFQNQKLAKKNDHGAVKIIIFNTFK